MRSWPAPVRSTAPCVVAVAVLATGNNPPKPPRKPPRWQAHVDSMSPWSALAVAPTSQPWVLIGAGTATVEVACPASGADTLHHIRNVSLFHDTLSLRERPVPATGSRRLVLTHFSQRYDDAAVPRLPRDAAAAYDGGIVLAADLDRIPGPAPLRGRGRGDRPRGFGTNSPYRFTGTWRCVDRWRWRPWQVL